MKMMSCDDVQRAVSAYVDQQLQPDQEAGVRTHVESCRECRLMVEDQRRLDQALRRELAPVRDRSRRLPRQVMQAICLPARVQSPPRPTLALPAYAVSVLMSLAAGFLLALVMFPQRYQPTAQPVPKVERRPPVTVANLDLTTGPLTVHDPSEAPRMVASPAALSAGAEVSTGPSAQCEIVTDGAAVRLDRQTVARFIEPKRIQLVEGRLWSEIPETTGSLDVMAKNSVIQLGEGKFNFSSTAEGDCELLVLNGSASIRRGGQTTKVDAGNRAVLNDSEVRVEPVDGHHQILQLTRWVHELLAQKGPDDPEWQEHMNQLLSQLGHTKISMLYDEEIRRLGPAGVLPLLRYVQSERSLAEQARRHAAMALATDMATRDHVADLIKLAGDQEPPIRQLAADALRRLTGYDFGPSPERWQQWWEQQ